MTEAVIVGEDTRTAASASATGQAAATTDRNPKTPVHKEIKPLTTLRFFAAFAVVVSHASNSFSCWNGLGERYIVGQAVTFFFVLSGFILTYNYQQLNGIKAALRFYLARVARIWPAHLCSLALLLVLIPEVFKVRSADFPLFFCNLFLLQSWIPSWHVFFSYNASSWSISTEMFFYLCFPLMLWGMNRKWYLPLAASATVLGALVLFANGARLPEFSPEGLSNQGLLYINPLSSIFDFCCGMTAAYLWRKHLSQLKLNGALASTLELAAIAGVCLLNVNSNAMRYAALPFSGDSGAYWIQNSGPSVLGFALLITIFAMDRGWISRLFSNSVLVLLGELSFGIYMLHGVLITYLGINFPQEQSLAACLAFLVVLLGASHLMFEMVEKPMRKFMLERGQVLLSSLLSSNSRPGQEPPPRSPRLAAEKSVPWRRRAWLSLEVLAFSSFVYFCLPTLHLLNHDETKAAEQKATLHNIAFPPYLRCRSAKASLADGELLLSIVLEAMKTEQVNFTVTAVALDASGKELGAITYTEDGRRQTVKRGSCWLDERKIRLADKKVPATVAISILRNKHETLHTDEGSAGRSEQLLIPVK